MKRCPQCNRTYADETQNFCLDEGAWLIGASEDPATAILAHTEPSDAPTRQQVTVTQPTEIMPAQPDAGCADTPRYRRAAIIVGSVLVLILGGAAAWMYRSSDVAPKGSAISLQNATITRLTTSGKVIGAAISPDGKYVAHVVDDGGQQSIWVRQVATSSDMQLVPPAEVAYSGLTFSPDGNYVYYSVNAKGAQGVLYQVPSLGGIPRKLITDIGSGVAFSPDGSQFAFFRGGGVVDTLIISNADGTGERELVTRGGDEQFFRGTFSTVSWSPDGKTIAGPLLNFPENYMTVVAVAVETGEVKGFTSTRWFQIKQVSWLRDGTGVLVSGQDSANGEPKLWHVSYPAGEVQKITNDLNGYRSVSLTADNSALITVQAQRSSNNWVMPVSDSARAIAITKDRAFHSRIAWTPDGRLIYNSNANGSFDLYIADADGNNSRQLTNKAGWNGDATVSADGRTIYFMSDRAGPPHVWRMDIDGGNQKQLTTEAFNVRPQLSPDGQWIVYASSANQGWYLWKMPSTGGTVVQITKHLSDYPAFSPDGKMIACYYSEDPSAAPKIAILSIEGGEPVTVFAPDLPVGRETNLQWTRDGRSIVYGVTRNGVANLWAQPIDGGDPRQITNFTSERILWFEFSQTENASL